ncbi:hypothetical protein RCL1_006862 [Eukaryota sp. TZLM3-RCL]
MASDLDVIQLLSEVDQCLIGLSDCVEQFPSISSISPSDSAPSSLSRSKITPSLDDVIKIDQKAFDMFVDTCQLYNDREALRGLADSVPETTTEVDDLTKQLDTFKESIIQLSNEFIQKRISFLNRANETVEAFNSAEELLINLKKFKSNFENCSTDFREKVKQSQGTSKEVSQLQEEINQLDQKYQSITINQGSISPLLLNLTIKLNSLILLLYGDSLKDLIVSENEVKFTLIHPNQSFLIGLSISEDKVTGFSCDPPNLLPNFLINSFIIGQEIILCLQVLFYCLSEFD